MVADHQPLKVHEVGVRQLAVDPVGDMPHHRLAREVRADDRPRLEPVGSRCRRNSSRVNGAARSTSTAKPNAECSWPGSSPWKRSHGLHRAGSSRRRRRTRWRLRTNPGSFRSCARPKAALMSVGRRLKPSETKSQRSSISGCSFVHFSRSLRSRAQPWAHNEAERQPWLRHRLRRERVAYHLPVTVLHEAHLPGSPRLSAVTAGAIGPRDPGAPSAGRSGRGSPGTRPRPAPAPSGPARPRAPCLSA